MNTPRNLLTTTKNSEPARDLQPSQPTGKGEYLVCLNCLHRITSSDQRISMGNAREHVFTNPLGRTFRVGCFRRAPGCRTIGEPTTEHTWFAGYAWAFAVCGGCGEHLGWRYADGDVFFGLILTKLVSRPIRGPAD